MISTLIIVVITNYEDYKDKYVNEQIEEYSINCFKYKCQMRLVINVGGDKRACSPRLGPFYKNLQNNVAARGQYY